MKLSIPLFRFVAVVVVVPLFLPSVQCRIPIVDRNDNSKNGGITNNYHNHRRTESVAQSVFERFVQWLESYRQQHPGSVGQPSPSNVPPLWSTKVPALSPELAAQQTPPTNAPAQSTTSSPLALSSPSKCTCDSCTDAVWNTLVQDATCGARITYLQTTEAATYPTEVDACSRIGGLEFPVECGACDPIRCDGRTPPPTVTPVTHCNCNTCTDTVWRNTMTDGDLSCAARITWAQNHLMNGIEIDACRLVASQFPSSCGAVCNPDLCIQATPTIADPNGRIVTAAPIPPPISQVPVSLTNSVTTSAPAVASTPILPLSPPPVTPVTAAPLSAPISTSELYCYPNENDRQRWTKVWKKYTVEVKESDGLCGPGNNKFSRNTVSLSSDRNELTLQFKMLNNMWTGSEVRVLVPANEQPMTYGTFKFSVKSVVVINSEDGTIKTNNDLPPSLVIGLFTWDPTDNYAIRENYSHEVDIEISRWNNATDHDAQFLVQPPGSPQMRRFSTGSGNLPRQPGGHIYEFTWKPGEVTWFSDAGGNGGHMHTYSTSEAIQQGVTDYVQCLPDPHLEIRMNLWNYLDTQTPTEMDVADVVEVVIDNFQYLPATDLTGIRDGNHCSKDCQCQPASFCSNQICIKR